MRIAALASLWIALPALAQGPVASDCLIDQKLPAFEAVTGYTLSVARDGTAFKPAERRAFDQIAALLPDFYRRMKSLTRFERVPDGAYVNGGEGQYTFSRWFGGEIYLAEKPVRTADGRFLPETFQWNAIHEMSHAVDELHGNWSTTPEWKDLSTWNADGQGTSRNFVSWYAPYGVQEDLAESMTAFLLLPDELLAKAPTKFEAISRKFYGGRRFDRAALERAYATQLAGLTGEARAARVRQLRLTDYFACKLLQP